VNAPFVSTCARCRLELPDRGFKRRRVPNAQGRVKRMKVCDPCAVFLDEHEQEQLFETEKPRQRAYDHPADRRGRRAA